MGKPKVKFDTKSESPEQVRELGNKKKFHPQDLHSLQPKSKKQEEFLHAFFSQTPIILQKGSAGTGKSYLAVHAALAEVFSNDTPFDRLVIVRSAVETRNIGYLPGTAEDKQEPYEAPFREIVDAVVKYNKSYDNLKALGYLDFMLSSFVRGLTLDNTILVIEECQNMDQPELLSILTRIGVNSKIVLCGDSKQDDLFRQRHKSGFGYLEKLMENIDFESKAVIEYGIDDIVRSDLVKKILIADSKIT